MAEPRRPRHTLTPIKGASTTAPTSPPRPPLMSHEQRQALIRRPFLSQHIPGKSWAGVLIPDSVPVDGQRAFDPDWVEDESYIRYGRSENDV